jgi:hypothetical protein
MDEMPNGTDVIVQVLRKRQGWAHQPRDSLSKRVVESFNVTGQPRFFANRTVRITR